MSLNVSLIFIINLIILDPNYNKLIVYFYHIIKIKEKFKNINIIYLMQIVYFYLPNIN